MLPVLVFNDEDGTIVSGYGKFCLFKRSTPMRDAGFLAIELMSLGIYVASIRLPVAGKTRLFFMGFMSEHKAIALYSELRQMQNAFALRHVKEVARTDCEACRHNHPNDS